jgi:hypothetical protein
LGKFRQVSEILPGFGSFTKNLVLVSPEILVIYSWSPTKET